MTITTWILSSNSGRVNVPVLSDSGEKKDDPYSNWDNNGKSSCVPSYRVSLS